MRKHITIILVLAGTLLLGCGDEQTMPFTAASLKVVHAAVDAAPVHVNYFGREVAFLTNPPISYTSGDNFTLPAGVARDIIIVNSEDTLSQMFATSVTLQEGDMATLFLVGQEDQLEGVFLEEQLPILTDSLTGVRFINLSPDSDPVSVTISGQSQEIAGNLAYRDDSGYVELDASRNAGIYTFEFRDSNDVMIATASLDPLPGTGTKPLFHYQSFALLGLSDDGNGGNTLEVIQVNNYLKR